MIVVGVDPGTAWTGIAVAFIGKSRWDVHAAALCGAHRGIEMTAKDVLMTGAGADDLAVERFQIRPQGHQTFDSGDTLQLIGALRYQAWVRRQRFALVQQADPGVAMRALPIVDAMTAWCERWARPRRPEWQHARSAWRVLAQHLVSTRPELLEPFVTRSLAATYGEVNHVRNCITRANTEHDCFSPSARWSFA